MKTNRTVKYTIDWFIKKLRAIPSKKWCKYEFTDGHGRYCVLGHLGMRRNSNVDKPANELIKLIDANVLHLELIKNGWDIAEINNGNDSSFQQKTPKERVMASLNYIKKNINE